jgi:hypothetical protein
MTVRDYFPHRDTLIGRTIRESLAQGREEGVVTGRAQSVLRVLAGRHVPVSEAVRERVLACGDLEVLDAWLDRALSVGEAEDLFADQ